MAVAALAVLQQAAGAIGGVVDQIKRLPDVVSGFVAAFDPTQIQRLDYAYKSLYSTVGFALTPIIGAATRTVEQFADAISGGMEAIRGPIEKVAGTFLGALQPAIAAASDVFDGLASAAEMLEPLMTPLEAVIEATLGLGRALTAIGVETLLAVVKQLIPSAEALQQMTDWVTQTFLRLAEATLQVTDSLLSMVGRTDVLASILERLAKEPAPGGRRQGAPENFQIGGTEDVYRRRLLLAAQARAKDPAEESRDYLKDLRELAKQMLEELKKRPTPTPQEQAQNAADVTRLGIDPLAVLWDRLFGRQRQADRNAP